MKKQTSKTGGTLRRYDKEEGGVPTITKQTKCMKFRIWFPYAIALLAAVAAMYAVWSAVSLRADLENTRALFAQSEEARISGMYDLEKEISSLRRGEIPSSGQKQNSFGAALRAGEIESVLILGDSISDGNGDHYYLSHDKRAEQGFRRIMTEGETTFYEGDPRGQGWVKYFREYLLENTSVTTFHNNSIGGMSAKWFNAHREEAVSQDYDAIVVMLGTNDRWACSGQEEFYLEYASLLSYLEGRCKYLQVLTPIPAFNSMEPSNTTEYFMDTRQVSDVVQELCADRGYACANLYSGLLWYAQIIGIPLDECYFGGTHPSPGGYRHLWRLIAGELGLNLDIGEMYDVSGAYDVADIGVGREEVTEETGLYATFQERDIFPTGISLYWQGYSDPFVSSENYGGTVITYRYETGGGIQIHKPLDKEYHLIRYAGTDGSWSQWYLEE